MSISGSLSDIALVDLLQFLHMSQRSGTLLLEHDDATAHISFHRGRIASAWGPCSGSVVQYLLDQGITTEDDVEMAEVLRRQKVPQPSLGQAMLDARIITWDELRDAVCRKIERTIFELISWTHGRFHVIADEVRIAEEMTFAPGDVVPNIDLDTQAILLEAVRLFDERNRHGRPSEQAPPAVVASPARPRSAPPARAACIQVVSPDGELAPHVARAVEGLASVVSVELRDAGIAAPGGSTPIVLVDRRNGSERGAVGRLREFHPRSPVIALVGSSDESAKAFEEGAVAVTEHAALAACCSSLVRSSAGGREAASSRELHSGLARLRRVLGELRSGLLSATVSLNLMSIVADSVERAVLFVQQRDALIALGAFGATLDGRPLAGLARGLIMPLARDELLARCISDGHAVRMSYDTGDLPLELGRIVDRPRSGQGVFFPVLGARRAIGLIYADNGQRPSSIEDVEIVELATAQVGLAFENELLRRRVDRAASEASS